MPISDPFDPAADAGLAAQYEYLAAAGRAPHPLSPRGRQLREAYARHELRKSGARPKRLAKLAKAQWAWSAENKPGSGRGSGDGRGRLAGPAYDRLVAQTVAGLPKTSEPVVVAAGHDDDDVARANEAFEKSRRALAAFEAVRRDPVLRAKVLAAKSPKQRHVAGPNPTTSTLAKSKGGKKKDHAGLTEFEYIDPDRVDAVAEPANGIPFLLLKSLGNDAA